MNKLIAIGNVGRVEIKQGQHGSFATLSLACTDKWKDQQGNPQERTEWFDCVISGGMVGVVEKYVDKGTKLYIEASAKTREYTDNQGNQRKATSWTVRSMEILAKFKGDQGQAGQQAGQPNPFAPQAPQQPQQGFQQAPQQPPQGYPQQPGQGGYPPAQTMAQAPMQQQPQAPQQPMQQQAPQQMPGTDGWDEKLPF